MSISDIREIPFGSGLLVPRATKSMMLEMRNWRQRPDAEGLQSAKEEMEDTIVTAARAVA